MRIILRHKTMDDSYSHVCILSKLFWKTLKIMKKKLSSPGASTSTNNHYECTILFFFSFLFFFSAYMSFFKKTIGSHCMFLFTMQSLWFLKTVLYSVPSHAWTLVNLIKPSSSQFTPETTCLISFLLEFLVGIARILRLWSKPPGC